MMSTCTVALLQVTSAGLDWAANLTNNPMSNDISPGWSADGMQVFFRSDRDGERFDCEPYVMNADGFDVTGVG